MASSVRLEVQKRSTGLVQPDRRYTRSKMSSPSRPASVAFTTSLMSSRARSRATTSYWSLVEAMGAYWKGSGKKGTVSSRHCLSAGS